MTDPNRDNPIDDLFRRKAEEYNDISFNEADWQNLEKKLEARDQLAAGRRRQYWLTAAATLIIALLSYYTYQNTTELNELNQILSESMTEVPEGENSEPNSSDSETSIDSESTGSNNLAAENNTGLSSEPLNTTNRDQSVPDEALADGALTDEAVTASGNSTTNNPAAALLLNDERDAQSGLSLNEGAESVPGTSENQSAQTYIDRESPEFTALDESGEWLPAESCLGCEAVTSAEFVPVQVDIPTSGITAANQTGGFADNNNTFASADQPITYRQPRLTIGVNVSPDLSSAGSLSNYTGPGYRLGVTIDYRISKNLSISTGVIHSTVKYNANRGDYNPPSEYFYGRYSPVSTFAECVLLDIPLRLKMDVWNNNRSGLFVSAGLSSYLMLNEEYQFKYENSQPELGTHWADRTGTFHLMSNAGFSVGYEMSLMPSVSLRAEPYLRLPLREVGWGNVRLYSVGTLFSLNYQFM